VTEKPADAVLGAGPPLSLRVVRASAPSLSLRSLQGQGGDFGFGSILSEGDQIPRPVAENATRTGHPFFCVVKAWASPPVKGPTLAAKNATRMGHPADPPVHLRREVCFFVDRPHPPHLFAHLNLDNDSLRS
jgi:hypothetical protein